MSIAPRELLLHAFAKASGGAFASLGFRFSEKSLKLQRRWEGVEHSIQMCLNRHNSSNECHFWTNWSVTSAAFGRWHRRMWNEKAPNTALFGALEHNIPNWPRTSGFHLRNDGTDKYEMREFITAATSVGIPFLESVSTYADAANIMERCGGPVLRVFDLLVAANETQRAVEYANRALSDKSGALFQFIGAPDRLRRRLERLECG